MARKFKVGAFVEVMPFITTFKHIKNPLFGRVTGYFSGSSRPYDLEVYCVDGKTKWASARAKDLSEYVLTEKELL